LPIEQDEEPKPDTKEAGSLRKELDKLTKQKQDSDRKAADYYDRLQRLQADMENLQKITRRQSEAAIKQASERMLTKLLPILDALQQAENMAYSGNALPPDEIAVGLKMLHKQLIEILSSEGLEEIASVGKTLDPGRHEVVSYVETDDSPENTVVEEIRKGYTLNGKVVRPSLVVVAKQKAPEEGFAHNAEEGEGLP
jgi:molecular chaperone GrpE